MLGQGPNVMWFCILAATIYGFGKTFFWPTMLGVVSERFPKGGALTLGMVGGVGMLSAGLLGGPAIGYQQDSFAIESLHSSDPDAYSRYSSATPESFLFFAPIHGLDNAKVGTLNAVGPDGKPDPGWNITDDIANLEKGGRKLSDDKNLESLNNWWSTAKSDADQDKKPVNDSRLYGGKMALSWTAAGTRR